MLRGFSGFLKHVLSSTIHMRLFSYKKSDILVSVTSILKYTASKNLSWVLMYLVHLSLFPRDNAELVGNTHQV